MAIRRWHRDQDELPAWCHGHRLASRRHPATRPCVRWSSCQTPTAGGRLSLKAPGPGCLGPGGCTGSQRHAGDSPGLRPDCPLARHSVRSFLTWFSRAYKNQLALGARRTRFGPGWAIGSWFVPILSLFRPLQMVSEVWHTSAQKAADPIPASGTGLLAFWWTAWILSNILGQVSFRMWRSASDLTEDAHFRVAIPATKVDIAFDVCSGLSAVALILLLRRITQMQESTAGLLETGNASVWEDPPGEGPGSSLSSSS